MLIVLVATLLQKLIWPIVDPAPYLLFYPAIILAVLYGNGISCIILSIIVVQYFFTAPIYSFQINWPADIVRHGVFLIAALMIRNITRKLAHALAKARCDNKRAQDAELRLAITLSSIGDGVLSTDNFGAVTFMNVIAEKLTGYTLTEARGKHVTLVLPIINLYTRKPVENPVVQVLKKGEKVILAASTVLVSRDGTNYIIEDSASPIRAADSDKIHGVVLVFRDVTLRQSQKTEITESSVKIQQSEERAKSILQHALDAVVEMDDKGFITGWNPQAEKIFGFPASEAQGLRMSETIIPLQYRQAHENGMRHYLQTGLGPVLGKRFEITALRRIGEEFPIELSITPIRMGQKISFAAFIRDISEQKNLQHELILKSNALENSSNGFDIIDENGKFVYVNPAYLKMWGYESAKEVIGTSPALHCVDPQTPTKIITQLKETGRCDIEFAGRRKDGSIFDVRMWARLAHDSLGKEVYPTTSIDITELKQAEKMLIKCKDDAEKANQAKSQFLANMSHEIRTPIGVIQGFADLLDENNDLPKEQHEWVQTIRRNAQLLTRVIGEVLDLSRINAEKLELEWINFSLTDVITDISSELQLKAEEKGIVLSLTVNPDVPPNVTSDPTRLRQILINLIGNSIKFTERGSVHVHFSVEKDVESNQHAKKIKVTITDTGIGMNADQQTKVFEPFVQGDSSTTRRFGGSGLGLTISKKLAVALKGDLHLSRSIPGKGTTFEFFFCCAGLLNLENEAQTETSSKQQINNLKTLQPIGQFQGKKILLVEDSLDVQILVRLFLRDSGAHVDIANNGRHGVEKAKTNSYDLILMDIQMPEMDGYEALRAILTAKIKVPILALTAHALKEERERAQTEGFTDFLTKPISKPLLIQKIKETWDRKILR